MPVELQILCNVERLWPYDDDAYLWFGLNFMVAVRNPDPKTFKVDWIRPWHWDPIDLICVQIAGKPEVVAYPAEPPGLGMSNPDLVMGVYDELLQNLLYTNGNLNIGFLSWAPNTTIDAANRHNVVAILGDLTTRPAAIQQGMNLSRYFKVPRKKITDPVQIIAAPRVVINGEPARPTGKAVFQKKDGIYIWKYASTGSLRISASVQAPDVPGKAPSWLYKNGSTTTYWIVPPSSWEYDDNPVSIREARSALEKELDLPPRLVDSLDKRNSTDEDKKNMWRTLDAGAVVRFFYAVLRDQDPTLPPSSRAESTAGEYFRTLQDVIAPIRDKALKPEPAALKDPLNIALPNADAQSPVTRDLIDGMRRLLELRPVLWERLAARRQRYSETRASRLFEEAWRAGLGVPARSARSTNGPVSRSQQLGRAVAEKLFELAGGPSYLGAGAHPVLESLRDAGGAAIGAAPDKKNTAIPPYWPTPSAHPFAVPVGSVDEGLTAPAIARHWSGYGMLARVEIAPSAEQFTPWRCVTAGSIAFLSPDKASTQITQGLCGDLFEAEYFRDSAVTIAATPVRPSLAWGESQQKLTYEARPMTARNPLGALGQAHQPTMSGAEGQTDTLPAPLRYEIVRATPCSGAPEEWAYPVPDLKFGRKIQAAVFAVPNSGALPTEINGSYPGEFCVFPPKRAISPDVVYTEYYQRRVLVGGPQIVRRDKTTAEPFLSPDLQIVTLERELERDVLANDAGHQKSSAYYFSVEPSSRDQVAARAVGTLDLTGDAWSILIDGIALRGGASLRVAVEYAAGTIVAVDLNASLTGPGYFDLRIEATKDEVRVTGVRKRSLLFDGDTLLLINTVKRVSAAGARIVLTISGQGSAIYRRPRVRLSAAAPVQRTTSNVQSVLLADENLRVNLGTLGNVPQTYRFNVRFPPIDLLTWDRSESRNPNDSKRVDLWKKFAMQAATNSHDAEGLVDDPAVDDIWLEARCIHGGDPETRKVALAPLRLERAPYGRALGREISITARTDTPATAGANEYAVRPGEIWEFRFYSAVKRSEFGTRIHDGMREERRENGEFVLFGPSVLRVEAAKLPGQRSDLEFRSRLTDGIQPAFPLGERSGNELRVTLKREAVIADDDFWLLTTNAELHMQEWRWLGRPFSTAFPFDELKQVSDARVQGPTEDANAKQKQADEKLSAWEDQGGFNGRRDEDARVITSQLGIYDTNPQLFFEDISTDARALYHRYMLRLWPRYNALTAGGTSVFFESCDWKREFVPCRRLDKVPKPNVRLVVPLTQAAEWDANVHANTSSPGLLVFVAERWFGVGGLNEFLGADIVETKDEALRVFKLPEIGYDPRLTDLAVAESVKLERQHVIGPIGHTLDIATETPLFRACSFIIRLPAAVRGDLAPMALLRFYRYLRREGLANQPSADLYSEFLAPMPVQFQPDPSRLLGAVDPKLLSAVFSAGSVAIHAGDSVVKLPLVPISEVWCLITERIVDAFGREQEEFYAMYRMNISGQGTPIAGAKHPPSRDASYFARLMQVEISRAHKQPSNSSDDSVWNALFPSDASGQPVDKDATARVLPLTFSMPAQVQKG